MYAYSHACGRAYAVNVHLCTYLPKRERTDDKTVKGSRSHSHHTPPAPEPTCHSFGHAPVMWIKFGFTRAAPQVTQRGFNSSCFRSTFPSTESPALIYIAFSTRVSFHG